MAGKSAKISPLAALCSALEFHLRHRTDAGAFAVGQFVEGKGLESKHASKQHRRKTLPRGVVIGRGRIERAARGGKLVLSFGKLALQCLEVSAGLELGIGLAQCQQITQRTA